MTQKELLYIDDALSHAQSMDKAFTAFAANLQDPELKTFVQGLASKSNQNFSEFFSLIK